jgi:hypothetical protein
MLKARCSTLSTPFEATTVYCSMPGDFGLSAMSLPNVPPMLKLSSAMGSAARAFSGLPRMFTKKLSPGHTRGLSILTSAMRSAGRSAGVVTPGCAVRTSRRIGWLCDSTAVGCRVPRGSVARACSEPDFCEPHR